VIAPELTLALTEEIGDNGVRPDSGAFFGGWTSVLEDENKPASPSSTDTAALARLLERGKAGDERALESLYEMNKARIYRLAYRHTFNPATAEDLLQDTFIKVFSHLDDVKDPATFPAWLYRVALNTCYSYLRGKKIRSGTMVPLSAIEGRLEEATYDAHETDLRGPIESALETLPAKLKRIFILHDIEGFKHGEISRMLGCSVGTSKSQLFKARLKVRRVLMGRGIGKENES
jgi:RNA polymerase sigma-70 factor, ECF subfamily